MGGVDEEALRWVTPSVTTVSALPPAQWLDPQRYDHVVQAHLSIEPWMASGFTWFWYDAASENIANPARYGFLEWSYEPYHRAKGIRFGGETIPVADPNTDISFNRPDICAIEAAPWMGLQQVFLQRDGTTWKNHWTFNRQNTEVHLLIQDARPGFFDWFYWREARARGIVISLFNCNEDNCRLMTRWYSMGKIYLPDFNGDGLVTPADPALFEQMFNDVNKPVKVFATGDITGNGQIDAADYQLFYQAYNSHIANGRNDELWLRDFGAPDDL